MSGRTLPFRIRSPLGGLLKRKSQAKVPTGAKESGPAAGEGLWSARQPPNYVSMTLRSRVYDIAKVTAYEVMPGLSERTGSTCYAKREDTQPGFSNNLRGVYNRMFNLSEVTLRETIQFVREHFFSDPKLSRRPDCIHTLWWLCGVSMHFFCGVYVVALRFRKRRPKA